MKKMNVARGTTRAIRRASGGGTSMKAPAATAQAAQRSDQVRANRKLSVKLYHKAGVGIA